jgi:hypothetical protein
MPDAPECIPEIDEPYDFGITMAIATHAYDEVPESLRKEVSRQVDRILIGDRTQDCGKCGRKVFWTYDDICMKCNPNWNFYRSKADCETIIKMAINPGICDLSQLYAEYNLEPKISDRELWKGAVETVLDAFIGHLDNYLQENDFVVEFMYSGYEEHGFDRCEAFFNFAYRAILGLLRLDDLEFYRDSML